MKHSRGKTGTFRRIVIQVSICLLLGAIVNIAVAWGFAWFTPQFGSNEFTIYHDDDNFDGTMREVWEQYFPSDLNKEAFQPLTRWKFNNAGLRYDLVDCRDMKAPPVFLQVVQAGYPMNCLSYHYWIQNFGRTPSNDVEARFALLWKQPPPRQFPTDQRTIALPLRPLWPAFAINTIFYSVIIWMLFFAPFVLRRWRRIRLGLCTKCGYDLRGVKHEKCPECGVGITRTKSS